jgi:hypothetical protein
LETLNIPMEAETIPMLISGFGAVIVVTVICILLLRRRNKDFSYVWFMGQVLFLVLGFNSALKIFDLKSVPGPMLSEEVSLVIGLSALFWALSMVCMVIGIWKIVSKQNNQSIRS